MKRFIFLATFILSLILSPSIGAVSSGKCGDNITWILDNNYNLKLIGTGDMYNYTDTSNAPWSSPSVKSVTISRGITSIGDYAFNECRSLTNIEIPNTVTSIGKLSFCYCMGLTSIEIPNSVTSIGDSAFFYCGWLQSIEIPNSVTSIGEFAFSFTAIGSVEIPNSVTSISRGAFSYTPIESVEIPNSVTSIGDNAFNGCQDLERIEIPNSVTSIGKDAFVYCSKLSRVDISDISSWLGISFGNYAANPLVYGKYLYLNGEELKRLIIPDEISKINDYAFYNCRSLTSIEIPNSVTSIGNSAFSGCSCLTNIEIPNSVTSIGKFTFYNCSSLERIEIPNSVTSIENGTFCGCCILESIEIPNSVTSIGEEAFIDCIFLQKITSYAIEPPQCSESTFDSYIKDNCILEVPDNSIIKYRTADVWKDFLNMSGVESVTKDNEISVRSKNGEIIVTGADENADMNVYSVNGVKVYRGAIKMLQVPVGVYIVNISGKTFKVSVR